MLRAILAADETLTPEPEFKALGRHAIILAVSRAGLPNVD
jgi:hypothetical protein